MLRYAVPYGVALAALAFAMDWLGYRYTVHAWSGEFYTLVVAAVFVALGVWVGRRLTPVSRAATFAPNDRAMASLGVSAREAEVLALIAAGHSNKVIARPLSISPNTVKTHVAHLFDKLDVASRTQALERARALDILP